jgi:hypothetical protein
MARQFLTGLNLNKNELLNAKIQNLSVAPSNPTAGQIYFDTDTNQLTVWDGTSWVSLAAGGNVTEAINAAIDLLTTTVIEEGTNLYYTESRAKTDAAELLTGATKTNITITGDGSGLTITAENGVADSDTDDLTEGTTNLYFTDARARGAISAGDGIDYNSSTGVISADLGSGLEISAGEIVVDTDVIATRTYADEAASSAVTTHNNATSGVHGIDGDVVGDTDSQTLTNKTLGTGTVLSDDVDANGNTITDLGTPSANSDAATKGYVDTEISTHNSDTSVHGVGVVVGTTETQTLTNKTLGSGSYLGDDLSADNNRITDLAAPVNANDAATKAYVDAAAEGLHVKAAVLAATTGNLTATYSNGTSGEGATLTIAATATLNIDGVTDWSEFDGILVKDQTNAFENGRYFVDQVGDAGTEWILKRCTSCDEATEIPSSYVFVQSGTTYEATGWVAVVEDPAAFDVGTDDITWVQFSGAGTYTAGDGLTIDGNEFNVVGTADRITVNADSVDIASTYVGQSSITTLGTITTGVWNGTDIAIADGGTGASTAADARANLGATTKYTAANPLLTETSGSVTWTVTHNLGTRDVVIQVYDISTFEEVVVDVDRTNTNTATLSWVAADDVDADSYKVVIVG